MDMGGNIHPLIDDEKIEEAEKRLKRRLFEVDEKQARSLETVSPERRKGWMRNQPCPCGSGRKFKKCCWHIWEK